MAFIPHAPVSLGLAEIILEIMSLNFVFFSYLQYTCNEPINIKNSGFEK